MGYDLLLIVKYALLVFVGFPAIVFFVFIYFVSRQRRTDTTTSGKSAMLLKSLMVSFVLLCIIIYAVS
jgi:heme/copper-type cytochrome/quinol oxidase subunit 2